MTGTIPLECARYDEEWSALLDGELPAARAAELREHVAGCARCTAKLASLARVDVLLAGLPVPETRPDLFARVRARIEASDAAAAPPALARGAAPTPRRRWRALGALAAAAAAALALYLALPRPRAPLAPAPEPRTAQAPEPTPPPAVDPELDALPPEELALGLELDTARDLEVIANLELLEAWVALEEGRG